MAVQAARDAASSSWGLGPESSPPLSLGSSMVSWWSRILMLCRNVPVLWAVAFMLSPVWQIPLGQRVEHQSSRDLRVEERRLGRHVDPRGGDLLDLLDRAGAQEEGAVVRARAHELTGLVVGARVAEALQVGDRLLGHAEHALEHQGLQDGGVQVAVGLGVGGQRGVGGGLVLQGAPELARAGWGGAWFFKVSR